MHLTHSYLMEPSHHSQDRNRFCAQVLLSVYKFVNRLMKFDDKNMVKSLLFFYGRCVHLVLFFYANGCWIFPMCLLLIFCLILRKEFHRHNKHLERFVQDISNLDSGNVRVTFEQIRLRHDQICG